MNRPSFGRGIQAAPAPHPQQAATAMEEVIRVGEARIASIKAQMTAYKDMTAELRDLEEIVAAAKAKLAPPLAVVPPPEPPPPPEPGKVHTGPAKRA
jgi:hypothetical protein